jgi:hypothetical protein
MANKFQKSVLERLEEEAKRQSSQKKAGVTEDSPLADERAVEQEPAVRTAEIAEPENVIVAPVQESFIPDISQFIRHDPQRVAKNKTFYLDADVIDNIKITAKKQRTTDSKLVNDILRKILGL